jgi:hypothetical protein
MTSAIYYDTHYVFLVCFILISPLVTDSNGGLFLPLASTILVTQPQQLSTY